MSANSPDQILKNVTQRREDLVRQIANLQTEIADCEATIAKLTPAASPAPAPAETPVAK
jgi:hypothetical protein